MREKSLSQGFPVMFDLTGERLIPPEGFTNKGCGHEICDPSIISSFPRRKGSLTDEVDELFAFHTINASEDQGFVDSGGSVVVGQWFRCFE